MPGSTERKEGLRGRFSLLRGAEKASDPVGAWRRAMGFMESHGLAGGFRCGIPLHPRALREDNGLAALAFQRLVDSLFSTEWVVYLKESFQGSDSVIEYLARYTHRIAISNHRILSVDNGMVEFTYRDYKDGNRKKIERVDVVSFMRRFMLHVVPYRFVRIRYYGILSHRNKSRAITACRDFYTVLKPPEQTPPDWRDMFLKKNGRDCSRCPVCLKGRLVLKESIPPSGYRAPPVSVSIEIPIESVQ